METYTVSQLSSVHPGGTEEPFLLLPFPSPKTWTLLCNAQGSKCMNLRKINCTNVGQEQAKV